MGTIPALSPDETTPLERNQLQATKSACLHLAAGTGENAHAVPTGGSPTTPAPAYSPAPPTGAGVAGVPVHVEDCRKATCVAMGAVLAAVCIGRIFKVVSREWISHRELSWVAYPSVGCHLMV
ncbi:MAG TPA: hypothetical protein VFQ23_03680 [Anaerolineales bacterium]|nr:hypothetical protein [Anaerolineales bacterium]